MNKKSSTNSKSQINNQTKAAFLLTILSLIIFSISLFVFNASKPKVYEYGVYKTGTPISAGIATVTVDNISSNKGSGSFLASEGMQYLILDTTFKNNAGRSIQILPSTQTYIKDNENHVYYLTPASLSDPFRAGELLAGDAISGELSYMVPVDKKYTLYIDAMWSGSVVAVHLN